MKNKNSALKNRAYPLYELPHVWNLKELLKQKDKQMPEGENFYEWLLTFYWRF